MSCLEVKTECEVSSSYSRSIVTQLHHSSVIIIITITADHCSLFNVYQTVTASYCEKKTAGCSHCRWEFYFSPIKYTIPIPIKTIPSPNSTPKLLLFPRESHGNGNSQSHAHLYYDDSNLGNRKPNFNEIYESTADVHIYFRFCCTILLSVFMLIYTVSQKNVHLFIFQITLSKLTDFNDFWCVKSWENLTSIACTYAHLTCIL